jgi:hypothetical protein
MSRYHRQEILPEIGKDAQKIKGMKLIDIRKIYELKKNPLKINHLHLTLSQLLSANRKQILSKN